MPVRTLLLVLMLAAIPVAGCVGNTGAGPADQSELTDPANDTGEDGERSGPDDVNVSDNSTVEIKNETKFDPSSRVHPHDYWGDREEVVILDREVQVDWAEEIRRDPHVLDNPKFVVDILPEEREGKNFVFPGTGEIEITLSWSGGEGAKRLCVVNSGAFSGFCDKGVSHWYERSGDLWTIDNATAGGDFLTEETWDEPHSLKSDWRFEIWLCRQGGDAAFFNRCPADLDVDSFELTVTIARGGMDLPVDPPHFAFYEDNATITILDQVTLSGGPVQSNWFGQADRQARGDSRAYWYVSGFELTNPPLDEHSEVPVVAWATQRLVATLEVDALNSGPSPLVLNYRTASDPWSTEWNEAGEPCSDTCIYEIPVDSVHADSPYALRTQWEFGIFPAEVPAQPLADYEVGLKLIGHKTVDG